MDDEEADALVHQVVTDWRQAALAPADQALCEHSAKLTGGQVHVTPGDLEDLRAAGLDDRAIHDATQVIAFFNYITRVADGLGVESESFIRQWGARQPARQPKRLAGTGPRHLSSQAQPKQAATGRNDGISDESTGS